MRLSSAVLAALTAGLAVALPSRVGAQTNPDIIRGTITGSDSLPVVNANVLVTAVGTNVSKPAKTNERGTFTVVFPEAEGDYWVFIQALGYVARRYNVKRAGYEDVLIADARLQKSGGPQVLKTVVTNGSRPSPGRGATRDITGNDITMNLATLGIDLMSDANALAMFLPEAIFIPGTDGGAGSFSLYGLDADQNTFTLNGLAISSDLLPRDAGMNATLSASPDASRAGGAGGQLDAVFGAGNNFIQRKLSTTGRSPKIQWSDATTRALGNQPTKLSLGGMASGPIARNALFYKFAFQYDDDSYALRSLLNTDAVGLAAAGLSPDSVRRLGTALDMLGVPLSVADFPSRNSSRRGSVIGGMTFTPPTARFGSLSTVFQLAGTDRAPASSSLLYELPGHSGQTTTGTGSISATHNVTIRNILFSSTTVGGSTQRSWSDPYLSLPSATIRVPSTLDDGSSVVRSVLAGGSPSLDRSSDRSSAQASNSIKWVSMSGVYTFTLGTNVAHTTFRSDQSTNRLGSYTFNSIADLEAGLPASFDRVLTPRVQRGAQDQAGIGLNAWWKADSTLNMSAGVRVDASWFAVGPVNNPLVEQTFGARNDRLPTPLALSPRVNFSKEIGTSSQISVTPGAAPLPHFRLAGQGGVFESAPPVALPNTAIDNTGLPSGIQRLSCTGDAVPVPDWRAALDDPSTIATTCADGSMPVFASTVPSVALINRGYRGVRRTSGTLVLTGPVLWNRFSMRAGLSYARNTHLSQIVDLNFDPTMRFTLADEGNRPVFVPSSAITPSTGRFAAASGRVSSSFDRVNETRSDLRGDSRTFNLSLAPLGYHPLFGYSLTYTMQLNRQMIAGSQSTVANPLDAAWAESNLGQTHRFLLKLNASVRNMVRFTWTMQTSSGIPITPRVAGDINGDGYANNDRAFIFAPATTRDSAVAAGMQGLLQSGSSIAQKCLRDQLGQLSRLGRCRSPWIFQGGNALQVLMNPLLLRMPQRAAIQFEIGNPIGAADLLMHGPDRIHGWGQAQSPDQTLLYVRGFDAARQRFIYDVNPRFGSTRPKQNLNRSAPVTFTALIKVDIAPSRERQTLTELLDRGRRDDQPRVPELVLKGTLGTAGVPNALIAMLQQADLMKLTVAQTDTLSRLSRWFALHLDSVWTPAVHALDRLPRDYNQGEAYAIYKGAREKSFDLMIKMAPMVKEMLTPSQERLLPTLLQAYLDVRYLKAQRSSSIGMSDGMFPLGGP